MIDKNELCTATDAADRWFVSARSVARWLADGRVRGVKIGRAWRLTRAEIERVAKAGA